MARLAIECMHEATATIGASLDEAAGRLAAAHADHAPLEAEILLAHVLSKPRGHLRAWPELSITQAQRGRFLDLITRRATGTPIAYLIGRREFWSLSLRVNEHTLIPRPDTERLVELALQYIPDDRAYRVADIGTGSGAIAIAIAKERPRCHVIATDISAQALAVARANAEQLAIPNIEFRAGDALAPLCGERLDMICSNPPYIAEGDPHLDEGDLPAEPREALVAGITGLEIIAVIARAAMDILPPEGWLLLEHGYDQGPAVAGLLASLDYREIKTALDYASHPRVTLGRRR